MGLRDHGDGTLTQHFDGASRLAATGPDTIVFTTDRQLRNPFADGTVRHHVLDPVTGETCATVDTAQEGCGRGPSRMLGGRGRSRREQLAGRRSSLTGLTSPAVAVPPGQCGVVVGSGSDAGTRW